MAHAETAMPHVNTLMQAEHELIHRTAGLYHVLGLRRLSAQHCIKHAPALPLAQHVMARKIFLHCISATWGARHIMQRYFLHAGDYTAAADKAACPTNIEHAVQPQPKPRGMRTRPGGGLVRPTLPLQRCRCGSLHGHQCMKRPTLTRPFTMCRCGQGMRLRP